MIYYNDALRLAPGHVKAHYGVGMALRQLGREAEAIVHFQEALQLNPKYGPAKDIVEPLMKEQKTGQAPS